MYLFSKKQLWLLLSLSLFENSFVTALQRQNDQTQNNYITTEEKKLQDQIVTFFKEHKETIAASGVSILLIFIFTCMFIDHKNMKKAQKNYNEWYNDEEEFHNITLDLLKKILENNDYLKSKDRYKKILECCKQNNLIDEDRFNLLMEIQEQETGDLAKKKDAFEYVINENKDLVNKNSTATKYSKHLEFLLGEYDNTFLETNFAKRTGILPDTSKYIRCIVDQNNTILFNNFCSVNAIGRIKISSAKNELVYMYVPSIYHGKTLSELDCHYIFVPFLQDECDITVDTLKKSVDMFVNNEFEKDCNRIITVIYGAVPTDNGTNTEDFNYVDCYTDYVEKYKRKFRSQKIITLIAIGDENLNIALEIIDHYNGLDHQDNGLDYQDKNNKEYLWDLKNKRGAFDLKNTVLMTLGIDVTKARYLLDLVEYTDIPQENTGMPKQTTKFPLIGSIINLYGTDTGQLKNKIAKGVASVVKYIDCRVCVNNEYNLTKEQFIPTALQFLSFEHDVIQQSSGFMTNMCLHIEERGSYQYTCTMGLCSFERKKRNFNYQRLHYTDENKLESERKIFSKNIINLEKKYEYIIKKEEIQILYSMDKNDFLKTYTSNTDYKIGKYNYDSYY